MIRPMPHETENDTNKDGDIEVLSDHQKMETMVKTN